MCVCVYIETAEKLLDGVSETLIQKLLSALRPKNEKNWSKVKVMKIYIYMERKSKP